jgi:type IX secretion system PorP/SprF family membrane protein
MRKLFSLLLSAGIASISAFAQQDAQITQFMNNRLTYNPGYAGSNGAICAGLLYRQQWTSFPGAPKTALLNVDGLLFKKHGLGLVVMNDAIGLNQTTYARLAYAYQLKLGDGKLGIGLDAGILNNGLSGDLITPEPGKNDPKLNNTTNANFTSTGLDLGLGLFYSVPGKYYAGISTSHIPASELKTDKFSYKVARHFYVVAGYNFQFSNPDHAVMPQLLIKSDASSTQFDINAMYKYKNRISAGLTFRQTDALALLLGYDFPVTSQLKGFRIGYSYDYTLSSLNVKSQGSHEIFLGYCYNIVIKQKRPSHETGRIL